MAAIGITTPTGAGARRRPTWLQGLAAATVVSVFLLVIIGGVVRVTGSGLGCPDWPLCYGKILPPPEYTAIIEYTHRFVASVIVGPLLLAAAAVALLRYRRDRWIWIPAAVSVPLLLLQGLLGGVTVLTELPGGIVALHLATAEALLAVCLLLMMASFRTPVAPGRTALRGETPPARPAATPTAPETALPGETAAARARRRRWALAAAASVYAVIVSGALVTAMGATGACITWPLCQGQAFPMHHLTAVHMFHRYVALVLGALLLYAVWRCIAGPSRPDAVRWLAWTTLAAFIAQVAVGAATVWLDFQPHWRALHLTAATAVWTAAAAMAIAACLNTARPTAAGDNSPPDSPDSPDAPDAPDAPHG